MARFYAHPTRVKPHRKDKKKVYYGLLLRDFVTTLNYRGALLWIRQHLPTIYSLRLCHLKSLPYNFWMNVMVECSNIFFNCNCGYWCFALVQSDGSVGIYTGPFIHSNGQIGRLASLSLLLLTALRWKFPLYMVTHVQYCHTSSRLSLGVKGWLKDGHSWDRQPRGGILVFSSPTFRRWEGPTWSARRHRRAPIHRMWRTPWGLPCLSLWVAWAPEMPRSDPCPASSLTRCTWIVQQPDDNGFRETCSWPPYFLCCRAVCQRWSDGRASLSIPPLPPCNEMSLTLALRHLRQQP